MEDSLETKKEKVDRYYLPYEGYKIRVSYHDGKYTTNPFHLRVDYLKPKQINISDSEIKQFVLELNKLLEGKLKNTVEKETIEITINIFSVNLPDNFYKEWGAWFSCLKDNKTNKIIGSYEGIATFDKNNRKYNIRSGIQLHLKYQGKGLCEPFCRMTNCEVVQKLGVEYLLIHVAADNRVGACRCYIGVALHCALRCFIDEKEVFNKDSCNIYTDKNYSLILIHINDINL
jgi:hypothetical protein